MKANERDSRREFERRLVVMWSAGVDVVEWRAAIHHPICTGRMRSAGVMWGRGCCPIRLASIAILKLHNAHLFGNHEEDLVLDNRSAERALEFYS